MVRKTQRVGDPKIWGPVMDGGSLRVGDPNRGGAAMDGESLRVRDPKIWEQGWMGVPK